MGKVIKKKVGECRIEMKEINGRVTFKCKNIKRTPTAQEILDSVKTKIIYR
jgi:hypothetical protein